MDPIFKGIIKDGKLSLYEKDRYIDYLLTMDGNIELIVRRPKKSKTNPQLRYLFGVVYKCIGDYTGMDEDEIDIAMKMMFAMNKDTAIPTIKMKRNMTTIELAEFTEQIKRWASEYLAIYIPEPHEVE